jgi:methylphosphotriester-DNA--protein-cysteine methyltransferase
MGKVRMRVVTDALDRSLSRLDSVVFRSDTAAICTFRCTREDPMFEDSGPIGNAILVFPRTITGIRQEGGETYVGNPNRVGFYNAGQEYVRWPVSKRGDRSDWYWIRTDVLEEIVRRYDPSVEERPGRPFSFAWAPVDARVYLEQRRAWTDAFTGASDAFELEERILRIADRAIAGAYAFRGGARPDRSAGDRRRRAELVESALEILSRQTGRETTLAGLAQELSVSPFHLSRTFARHTGSTLAAHRGQIRLRLSLERLRDPRAELTVIAQDLGYSSHSHFTMAFRQAFGTTPSEFRRARG